MEFNRYIFDLYLKSDEGKKCFSTWEKFLDWNNWKNLDKENLRKYINTVRHDEYEKDLFDEVFDYALEFLTEYYKGIDNIGEYEILSDKEIFNETKIIWDYFVQDLTKDLKSNEIRDYLNLLSLPAFTIVFTVVAPQFFIPYFFVGHFYLLEELFKQFDIQLPSLPSQRKYLDRLNYYYDICEAFYSFRKKHNFTFIETFVFLFGFVGNIIKTQTYEIPPPRKVWISGGSPYEYDEIKKNPSKPTVWSANINSRPGDLQLIYIWTPVSAITACSTIIHPGYYDPFDYWCHRALVGEFKLFDKPIHFKQLKNDTVWKDKQIVKTNMQGVKNQPLTNKEYLQIKKMLGKNDILPHIEEITLLGKNKIADEKDVELKLLEPLLNKLGFITKDWIKQLPLRMGRGERVYPDYALMVDNIRKGEENAKFLWEAKYKISNENQLFDAFLQAKSYARRLNSIGFGIISLEGVSVFLENDKFNFDRKYQYTWEDLETLDNWNELSDRCCKLVIKK